jgi:alcohol dehydrogenase
MSTTVVFAGREVATTRARNHLEEHALQQLTFIEPGRLEWWETPSPVLDDERAALVRPLSVATCDLDAEIVAGRSPFAGPFPLGHEGVAEVIEVGASVGSVVPGDRVVVPFQISCGRCEQCLAGHTSNCATVPRASTYGFGPQVQRYGGFLADLVLVPFADHMLVGLPAGLSPSAVASVSDNIPDAWRAVAPWLARSPEAEVLVVGGWGAGSIGLYAAGIAVALGSRRVVYVDGDPVRERTATTLGAEIHAGPPPRRLGPFPITVNATSSQAGLDLAIRSTAPDGVCTSTGIFLGAPPTMPLLEMYEKVITFHTGRTHARPYIPEVLELVRKQLFAPELVTTRVVAWADAPQALIEGGWTKLIFER